MVAELLELYFSVKKPVPESPLNFHGSLSLDTMLFGVLKRANGIKKI